jgi:hypothetical protein
MNSTTTSKIASSRKDEKGNAFKGKEILPPDKITADDIHRALFNEFDMGCMAPRDNYRTVSCGNEDFEHHLF